MTDRSGVDLTPTYRGVLPVLLAAIVDGTPHGREMARQELLRMADVADLFNVHAERLDKALGLVVSDMLAATDFGMPVEHEDHPFHESVKEARAAEAALAADCAALRARS